MLDVTSSTRAAHDSVAGCGGGDTTRFWSGAADTLSCIAVMERSTSSASSVVETSEESRRVVLRSEKYQHKAAAPRGRHMHKRMGRMKKRTSTSAAEGSSAVMRRVAEPQKIVPIEDGLGFACRMS